MTTQKNQTLAIHFNSKKEIPIKINDTKKSKSINPLQFYIRNPFKNERHKKIIHFNFMREITLKINTKKN